MHSMVVSCSKEGDEGSTRVIKRVAAEDRLVVSIKKTVLLS